jgi:hypothetical protein
MWRLLCVAALVLAWLTPCDASRYRHPLALTPWCRRWEHKPPGPLKSVIVAAGDSLTPGSRRDARRELLQPPPLSTLSSSHVSHPPPLQCANDSSSIPWREQPSVVGSHRPCKRQRSYQVSCWRLG